MDYALLLVVVGCIAVGVVSAVINTWSLRSRVFSLEDQVAVMSGTLTREVKSRAGQERWKKPTVEDQLAAQLHTAAQNPQPRLNYWENPALKRGAFVK